MKITSKPLSSIINLLRKLFYFVVYLGFRPSAPSPKNLTYWRNSSACIPGQTYTLIWPMLSILCTCSLSLNDSVTCKTRSNSDELTLQQLLVNITGANGNEQLSTGDPTFGYKVLFYFQPPESNLMWFYTRIQSWCLRWKGPFYFLLSSLWNDLIVSGSRYK